MQFTFTLTQSDLVALHKVINRRLAKLSRADSKIFLPNLLAWITLGIAFAAYSSLYRNHPTLSYDLTVVAAALGLGVVLVVATLVYRQTLLRRVFHSPRSWFFTEQTVNVSPEGLTAEGSYGSARYNWSAFIGLAEDESRLYLLLDNAQAFVVPKAAVGSPENLALVKTWLHQAP